MKNPLQYLLLSFMVFVGCQPNDPIRVEEKAEEMTEVINHGPCGKVSAKFIRTWCGGDGAVIDVLSDNSMGVAWSWYKTYPHAMLAVLDSTLSQESNGWSKVTSSFDSVFYFDYYELDHYGNMCKMCCPPEPFILITSFGSHLCP